MNRPLHLIALLCTIACLVISACDRKPPPPQPQAPPSSAPSWVAPPSSEVRDIDLEPYQPGKESAMDYAQRQYEERLRTHKGIAPPIRLPNPPRGPGSPMPVKTDNFELRDFYPCYLLCSYGVKESPYDPKNESEELVDSLKQIRRLGAGEFPPCQWVAVIIVNWAEEGNFALVPEAHKVGAIYVLEDVFNPSVDLHALVARVPRDRHPFDVDATQTTTDKQTRWLIVEKHMAAKNSKTAP